MNGTSQSQEFGSYWVPKSLADKVRVKCICSQITKDKNGGCRCENISAIESILVSVVYFLQNKKGCFASNPHFAEYLGVSVRRVQQMLKNLVKKGYIKRLHGPSRMLEIGEKCPEMKDEEESATKDPS